MFKVNKSNNGFLNFCVSFKPLNATQVYGPNLKYIVKWRRRDTRESWNNRTVKGDTNQFTVTQTPIYTPYEIKVQAKNDYGVAMEPETVIGYSGEDCEYSHRCKEFGVPKKTPPLAVLQSKILCDWLH